MRMCGEHLIVAEGRACVDGWSCVAINDEECQSHWSGCHVQDSSCVEWTWGICMYIGNAGWSLIPQTPGKQFGIPSCPAFDDLHGRTHGVIDLCLDKDCGLLEPALLLLTERFLAQLLVGQRFEPPCYRAQRAKIVHCLLAKGWSLVICGSVRRFIQALK